MRSQRGGAWRVGETQQVRIDERIIGVIECQPGVQSVHLVGSRRDGTAHDRSDWDFVVYTMTDAFPAVARALPMLLSPLEPLSQQWDRLSRHACWMVMLRGPTKIDLIFPAEVHASQPPWEPSASNLAAIDSHFWDWILWLRSKHAANADVVAPELVKMFEHLLGPLGVEQPPATIAAAVRAYRTARDAAELRFRCRVRRDLEEEVAPALDM